VWMVLDKRNRPGFQHYFGPWGGLQQYTVTGELSEDDEDLDDLEVFNRVIVRYPSSSGVPLEVVLDASPDPIPPGLTGERVVNEFSYELSEPQPDALLPTTIASALLAYYSRQRTRGKLTVTEVLGPDGWDSTYALQAGALVTLADYRGLPPQRVVATDYGPFGLCDAEITEMVSVDGLLASWATALARAT
jgi:hypothetical protein